MKLKDKIAVVTGAGQGIGQAVAVLAAREGARVALVERNETTGRETLDNRSPLRGRGAVPHRISPATGRSGGRSIRF